MDPNGKQPPNEQDLAPAHEEHEVHQNPLTAKKIALFVLYAIIAACLLMMRKTGKEDSHA